MEQENPNKSFKSKITDPNNPAAMYREYAKHLVDERDAKLLEKMSPEESERLYDIFNKALTGVNGHLRNIGEEPVYCEDEFDR